MAYAPVIDPETQQYTDDCLIAKAFETLRVEFGNRLPVDFFCGQYRRALLALSIEGRSSDAVYRAIRPFAEAQSDAVTSREVSRKETADRLRRNGYHQMARLMERGMM